LFFATIPPATAQTAPSPREAAVALARAGEIDAAIASLKQQMAQGSQDPLLPFDLAVLLQQNGSNGEAIALFERAGSATAPEYAMLALARAYRDEKRFDDAQRLIAEGRRRFPGNATWIIVQALTLTDAGRAEQALALLAQPAAQRADPIERKLAEAHARQAANQPFEALRLYMDVLRLAPDNSSARNEVAALLRSLGAPEAAANWMPATAPPLEAARAGAMVRWGADVRPPDPAHRFDGTDAALARIDGLLTDPALDAETERHLKIDRLVALRDRVRMKDVVQESDALLAAGVTLPSYADEARADALLYLRRPEEAADVYRRVLAADPGSRTAPYGLFYAEVESEDFADAYQTLDALLADTAPTYRGHDEAAAHTNPDQVDILASAGMGRFYADQLAEAEARIAPLATAAPANAGLRLANATVMEARGHPRAAEAEAAIAKSLDPVDPGIELLLARLDMEAYRFESAAARLRQLQLLYPENLAVQHMAADLAAESGWLFELDVSPGWSRGGGSNASGDDLSLTSTLWSPAIEDNWRLFLRDDYLYGHPEEGFVERNRSAVGIELRTQDIRAQVYGTYSTGELDDPGAGFSVDWFVDDHLSLGVAGELFALATPLRGLFTDTKANEISGAATYRWDESRELSLRGAYLDFNDGNEQVQAGLNFQQRLIDIPHFDLTGRIDLFASTNSEQDGLYYAPEQDLTATAGLLAEHVLWRRYEASLVQALSVDAGLYAEKGYPSDWVAGIGYEHRWAFAPRTEFRYGVMLTRNVYDGDAEEGLALTFGLQQRF
jgi:biofilm PGA synthesis protein PgaA